MFAFINANIYKEIAVFVLSLSGNELKSVKA